MWIHLIKALFEEEELRASVIWERLFLRLFLFFKKNGDFMSDDTCDVSVNN